MLAILTLVRAAQACTYDGPPVLALDTASPDEVAPAPPEIVGVDVWRGRSGDGKACENLGSLTITVARPPGDPDSEDVVGYRLELLEGNLPAGRSFGEQPLLGPDLTLIWTDGAPPQEAFEATLALVPVDVAGNEGAATEVTVGDAGGCGCRSGAGGATWASSTLLVVALRRRSRSLPRVGADG